MSLQPCPKCNTDYDVGRYPPGQPVTCTACGTAFHITKPPSEGAAMALSRTRVASNTGPKKAPNAQPRAASTAKAPKESAFSLAIPGYEILGLLGQGGMGDVYRARQTSLDRQVAVKVLARQLVDDPDFLERFQREAGALAALNHPNIVSIFDRGVVAGNYYFIMEYIDGPSLRAVLQSGSPTIALACKLVSQICRALDYAHRNGVMHRDLKPENMLIHREGFLKVVDFGLVGLTNKSSNLTQTNMAMGSVSYMAPEQYIDAKGVDHRADLYSVGVIFYELLLARIPVGRYTNPSDELPHLDVRLNDVILRCLETDPTKRIQSAAEILGVIEAVAESGGTTQPRPKRGQITEDVLFEKKAEGARDAVAKANATETKAVQKKPSLATQIGFAVLWSILGALATAGIAAGVSLWAAMDGLDAWRGETTEGELRWDDAFPSLAPIARSSPLDVAPGVLAVRHGVELTHYDFAESTLTPTRWRSRNAEWKVTEGYLVANARGDGAGIRLEPGVAGPQTKQEVASGCRVEVAVAFFGKDSERGPFAFGPFPGELEDAVEVRRVERAGFVLGSADHRVAFWVRPDGRPARLEWTYGERTQRSSGRIEASSADGGTVISLELLRGSIVARVGGKEVAKVRSPGPEEFRGALQLACQHAICRFDDLAIACPATTDSGRAAK